MTRRQLLRILAALPVAAGCSSSTSDDADAATQGNDFSASCAADRLRSSALTAPEELRRYEHIVILMMENRSFDHYFGHLSLPTSMGGEGRTDVDGLKGNEVQYMQRTVGGQIEEFRSFHAGTRKIGDIGHSWEECHFQFNDGLMNGFIQGHYNDMLKGDHADCGDADDCAGLADPMAYYKREDTPVLHQLFDNYALCDRWFSSVMGPTWPNRFYLHAGTSMGIKTNDKMHTDSEPDDPGETRTIWHELKKKCVDAVNYSMDFAWNLGGFGMFNSTPTRSVYRQANSNDDRGGPTPPESFEEACENGTLPTVSIIDPAFIFAPCDDHPPHDIKSGQAFISSIYKLLTKNPRVWEKTLFIITYDEHGSFYDHVKPPALGEEEQFPEFRQLGFRVPALVIGPYVKKNYVSHVQYDHTSFLSTVTRRFALDPLNARVASANDVRDCIDRNAVETLAAPSPIALRNVKLSESIVHASIANSLGQDELAMAVMGRRATADQKIRATDQMLAAFDRIGVADIRR